MDLDIQTLQDKLKQQTHSELEPQWKKSMVASAVLAPLFVKDGKPHLLFTKRTDLVKHHKGQISFPGGRRDPEDVSMLDCALRETNEEIGVPPEQVTILGRLDEQPVITNYRIAPFVGRIPYPYDFELSASEIDRLIIVAVEDFFNPDVYRLEIRNFMNQAFPIHFYDVAGETIWGATGRILTNLLMVGFDYTPPAYKQYLAKTT